MLKPHGTQKVTVTGTVSFNSAAGIPVSKVYIRANGTATVLFLNATTARTAPQTGLGTSSGAINLYANEAREFDLQGEGLTSALVSLGTATEVEVEWEIG